MIFGSDQLKWMAFYSCNLLRDDLYRSDGIYTQMKSFHQVPMNSKLHVLQAFATEMRVWPEFSYYWTTALENSPLVPARNQGVIAAWNYVCRRTQQSFDLSDPSNVARSVYWPECQGDFIYGYGPQTEPNRNPNDPSQQDDLLERDEDAYAPDP